MVANFWAGEAGCDGLLRALLDAALGMDEVVERTMRFEDGRTATGLGEFMSLTELAVLARVVVLPVHSVLAVPSLKAPSLFSLTGIEESRFGVLILVKSDFCLCRALES